MPLSSRKPTSINDSHDPHDSLPARNGSSSPSSDRSERHSSRPTRDSRDSRTPRNDSRPTRNPRNPRSTSRTSRRTGNAVAASVAVLLALVLVATGLGAGFLLTRSRIPPSLTSSTGAGSVRVSPTDFDDSRSVALTVTLGPSSTVTMPMGGTVTAMACVPGGTVVTGSTPVTVNAVPVLALHTSTPPYRTLTSGTSGPDASAINQALRALGYGAPDSSTMTWATITAYNALARATGAAPLTAESNWALAPDAFVWLPADSLPVASCGVSVGQQATPGQTLFASASTPVKATLPSDRSGVVAGDRVISINGKDFDVPPDAQEIADGATLSAIAASTEYRLVTLGGQGGQGGQGGGQGDGGQSGGGTVNVSYTWRLKQKLDVLTVPPSALYDARGSQACVRAAGKAEPVRIVASQLGRTMVTPDGGDVFRSVEVEPTVRTSCRTEP